jgi:glutathione S-transferase
MKLYGNNRASNCRRVTMYLAMKGLNVEIEDVDLAAGANRTAEFLAKNPAGQIPVLELDDGSTLPESSVIVEYLEERFPEPPMIGHTSEARGRVRVVERIASDLSVLTPVLFQHSHPRFAGQLKQSPEAAEAVRTLVDKQLAVLEKHLGAKPYLAGDAPTVADITLFALFQFCRERLGAPFGKEYPGLDAWYERFSRLPGAAY